MPAAKSPMYELDLFWLHLSRQGRRAGGGDNRTDFADAMRVPSHRATDNCSRRGGGGNEEK